MVSSFKRPPGGRRPRRGKKPTVPRTKVSLTGPKPKGAVGGKKKTAPGPNPRAIERASANASFKRGMTAVRQQVSSVTHPVTPPSPLPTPGTFERPIRSPGRVPPPFPRVPEAVADYAAKKGVAGKIGRPGPPGKLGSRG